MVYHRNLTGLEILRINKLIRIKTKNKKGCGSGFNILRGEIVIFRTKDGASFRKDMQTYIQNAKYLFSVAI